MCFVLFLILYLPWVVFAIVAREWHPRQTRSQWHSLQSWHTGKLARAYKGLIGTQLNPRELSFDQTFLLRRMVDETQTEYFK
eukprot:1282956-Amphidinium_carterae.1